MSHVNGLILAASGVKNTKDITYTKAYVIEVWVCRVGKRKQSLEIYSSCFSCVRNAAFRFASFIVYLISLLMCCLSLYSWKSFWVTEDPTINSNFSRHIFPESWIGVFLFYVYSLFHIVVYSPFPSPFLYGHLRDIITKLLLFYLKEKNKTKWLHI